MKLLVKHFPPTTQWMKLMNEKSGWGLLQRTTEIAQITITLTQCHVLSKYKDYPGTTSEARTSPNSPKCNQLKSKDYQKKHKPSED